MKKLALFALLVCLAVAGCSGEGAKGGSGSGASGGSAAPASGSGSGS